MVEILALSVRRDSVVKEILRWIEFPPSATCDSGVVSWTVGFSSNSKESLAYNGELKESPVLILPKGMPSVGTSSLPCPGYWPVTRLFVNKSVSADLVKAIQYALKNAKYSPTKKAHENALVQIPSINSTFARDYWINIWHGNRFISEDVSLSTTKANGRATQTTRRWSTPNMLSPNRPPSLASASAATSLPPPPTNGPICSPDIAIIAWDKAAPLAGKLRQPSPRRAAYPEVVETGSDGSPAQAAEHEPPRRRSGWIARAARAARRCIAPQADFSA